MPLPIKQVSATPAVFIGDQNHGLGPGGRTLADGNRITRKSSALIYRDSEGRERREQQLQAIGPFEAPGGGKSRSFRSTTR